MCCITPLSSHHGSPFYRRPEVCAAGYSCLPDYSHFVRLRDDHNEYFIPQNLGSASQSGGVCVIRTTLCGVQYTFDQLIASLNYLDGGVGKDAYATVTCELIRKSFEKFGKGESKITYDLLGIGGVDAGDLTLLIRNGIKRGKADRMYGIDRGTEEQLMHLPKVGNQYQITQ